MDRKTTRGIPILEMLFTVYSRFVPNLTRQDGSAFDRVSIQSGIGHLSTTNLIETQPHLKGE